MRHLATERWSPQISQTYGEWIWTQEKSLKIIMIRVKKFLIGNLSVSCHMKFSFTRRHMMKIGPGCIWGDEVGRIWLIWYHIINMIWLDSDMVHIILSTKSLKIQPLKWKNICIWGERDGRRSYRTNKSLFCSRYAAIFLWKIMNNII